MKNGVLASSSRERRNPFSIWGLTGGVASGKSLAARFFREEGVPVLDADEIGRELRRPGRGAYDVILQRFGTADGRKLREIVFSDAEARRDLEAILHPLILAETLRQMQERFDQAPAGEKPVAFIYEAALLVETGQFRDLDGLIVIDAPVELRRARLLSRDSVTPELADLMIASQATDDERRQAATIVISNVGDTEQLRQKVAETAVRIKAARN